MSRVIRPEAASRARQKLLEGASLAMQGIEQSADRRDRLAFLTLCLAEVGRSIEQTAEAWERRGYWVKADRFRAEWRWLKTAEASLTEALNLGNLDAALTKAKELDGQLPASRTRAGEGRAPVWSGAWERWSSR